MSVQKGERRKMYDNIDYSVEVNFIKRLAPSASRYNFRSGGSRVNTAALRKLSQYRKLRWQERKLKEDICEMSSQLAAVGEHCGRGGPRRRQTRLEAHRRGYRRVLVPVREYGHALQDGRNEIMLFRSHVRNFVENGVSEAAGPIPMRVRNPARRSTGR